MDNSKNNNCNANNCQGKNLPIYFKNSKFGRF